MPYEYWLAERQMREAIEVIEARELGTAHGPIKLPDSWEDTQAPPNWEHGPILMDWPPLPAHCTWWGRRVLYLKMIRIRREWLRLWDSWM